MPRYIAFLRAVNVGGRVVKMAQLKAVFEAAGFVNVESFIASGNIIFSTKSGSMPAVVKKVEAALRQELGYDVPTFIRSDAEVRDIAARKYALFSEVEVAGAHSLNVGVMHNTLSADAERTMTSFNTACETFRVDGNNIHMLLHAPVTTSKFSITKFEKAIGAGITFRNMNTIERLAAKYPAPNK